MKRSQLKQLAQEGALGHAYIIHGSAQEQLYKEAQMLANFLEKGTWEGPTAPLSEALLVNGAVENLGIEKVRTLSEFLHRTPQASPRRVVIINQADDLTPQAQNALLKLAEEPPAAGLLILIAGQLGAFLPTLLSRFQKLYIASSEAGEQSEVEVRAAELVKKFLRAGPKDRSDLIKQMTKEDQEVEKGDKIVDTFVTLLIRELAKDKDKNWRGLKHALSRFSAMQQFSVNRKLQLESLIQWIP